MTVELMHGDCLIEMDKIETASVNALITDPPYPEIKRAYGKLTVPEWWDLMMGVCKQTRRILKPTGSAVFILQPNSEHVGQMRGWLWEFMAWVCRDWNMVQDAWWWNFTILPNGGAASYGLMRPSVKACVWAGQPACYRDQLKVLWEESDRNRQRRNLARAGKEPKGRRYMASGANVDVLKCSSAAERRGGVTPFNMIPFSNSDGTQTHGAGTPLKLADWWTRYICPPGGTICDPFMGSGTMGLAAIENGCDFVGIEKFPVPEREVNPKDNPDYFAIAQSRITAAQNEMVQADMFGG